MRSQHFFLKVDLFFFVDIVVAVDTVDVDVDAVL